MLIKYTQYVLLNVCMLQIYHQSVQTKSTPLHIITSPEQVVRHPAEADRNWTGHLRYTFAAYVVLMMLWDTLIDRFLTA